MGASVLSAVLGLDCHIAALKTLINLSNDDEKCAQRLCSVPKALPTVLKNLFLQAQKWHSPVSTAVAPEEKAREYDTMVLIVGLLVNLAGLHAGCRDSVRELRVSVSCPGTGKCADLCACGKRESGLVGLVDVFKRCRVASFGSSGDQVRRAAAIRSFFDAHLFPLVCFQADEERDRNVLLSYLALLLGCLVRENDTNAALIRPLLPGATFATLRKQLEDFAAYQRDVMYTRAEAAGESVGAGDQIEKDVLEMVELLRIRDESY